MSSTDPQTASATAPTADQPSALDLGFLRIPLIVVIAAVIISGVLQGVFAGRWMVSQDLKDQGAQLTALPEQLGPWILQEDLGLDEPAAKMLQCYGSTVRRYQHEDSGISVTVAALFGPRGPIAVHTPEICYPSAGNELVDDRRAEFFTVDGKKHELWRVQFKTGGSTEPNLDVYYGWSDGEEFVAANRPRFWMTDSLYKIQLAGPVANGDGSPCEDFLTHFLSELSKLIE